jgi:aminoglycoside phosphotransferase (APT) family kinase protein
VIPATLLSRIPGCAPDRPPREVSVLAGGGQLNRCLAVSTDEGRFVLRLRVAAGIRPGADPRQELRCHLAAAALGIAPAILDAADDGSWMLLDHVDAPVWREADLHRPERLEALGRRLSRLHEASPADVHKLDVGAIVEGQVAIIRRRNPAADPWLQGLRTRAAQVVDSIARHEVPAVLCHGDLTVANFIGPEPVMVDWEYARRADPVYDIACLLSYYPSVEGNLDRLLAAAGLGDADSRERLLLYRDLFEVFNTLWLVAQGEQHGDPAGLVRRPSAQ